MKKRKRVKSPEVEAVGAEEGEYESDANVLVAISEETELFHTPRGESYATAAVRGLAEAMPALSAESSCASRGVLSADIADRADNHPGRPGKKADRKFPVPACLRYSRLFGSTLLVSSGNLA